MTIYLKDKEIDKYIVKYIKRLEKYNVNPEEIDNRVTEHLQNNVVIKYSKEWQDEVWNNLMDTWNQPGGYWVLQDYLKMRHVEFEHYKQSTRRSYEKSNVSIDMAKKELHPKHFEGYKQYLINNNSKLVQDKDKSELEVECEVTLSK